MTTEELADLERKDPEQYARMLTRSYDILSNAGAHYVIDGQRKNIDLRSSFELSLPLLTLINFPLF
jgi:uncharacterized protein (DUF1330 family)